MIKRLLYTFTLLSFLLTTGCGTFSPIPAHGGGKRFSLEQTLISSAMRNAISGIPLEMLSNKRAFLEVSVISDEGGGFIAGGRPQISSILGLQRNGASGDTSLGRSWILGVNHSKPDSSYVKDLNFNSSDARQFSNLLSSYLSRNNVMINPDPDSDGDADYFLEIFVDVLGIWRSRTDWVVSNSERLAALISLEYVITSLTGEAGDRIVGRVSYEARYRENYVGWVGPTSSDITVEKKDLGDLLPEFRSTSDSASNLKRKKIEFKPPETQQPIQINPRAR